MGDTSAPDAKAIFLESLERKSPEELERFLGEACGDDAELRARVEDLIRSHQSAGNFLGGSAADVSATTDNLISEQPGMQIGPYRLLQELGQGGMGVVYMAEQTAPVERRVALKIIKPGMDTRQVIARFEAERQALALMDHPSIAKVLDAGTTEHGRPYFVMELVRGVPITKYCDEYHLAPEQRLQLFVPVCQAVQHAHQKGIIHRDLKPSNVLVALYDGQPVPKVIDFGVAKAISQKLTEKTMFTQIGQLVGTLEYMSPEQAGVNQLDVDTRSDVYSLGVLLYELLTGVTPLDRARLQSAAFDEMMRIIREEETPRPSTRLSTIDTLASVAANRRLEPQKLRTLVRGELDWIVMKALEKDRGRRYETATGFAADIQNYLNDAPVIACPPSMGYRFGKFAKRNQIALGTAAIIAVALMFGMATTTWQSIRAARAEAIAIKERNRARQEEIRASNEAARADANSRKLARELRLSTAMRLTVSAQAVQNEFPLRSSLLAMHAIRAALQHSEPILPIAHELLLENVGMLGGTPLVGHEGTVTSVAVSPDSRWLVTGSGDETARLWDLTVTDSAESAHVLRGHEGSVLCVAFGPNNRWLVTGSSDKTARLWDLTADDTADSSRVLWGHEGAVTTVAVSPDGRWLVTGGSDKIARLWNLTAENPADSSIALPGHEMRVMSAAIGPSSRWLVTGSYDGTVRLWDLTAENLATSPIVLRGHKGQVWSVAFDPTGHWLATGSNDQTARLWDLTTEKPAALEQVLSGHAGLVRRVTFSPDARWLVTAGGDATARLWDLTSEKPGALSFVLRGHDAMIQSVAISSDSHWLTTASSDKTVRLWDLHADDPASSAIVLKGHEDQIWSSAITRDGHWIVTGSGDQTARLWDLTGEQPAESAFVLRGRERHSSATIAVSRSSRWLVTSGFPDKTAQLWNLTANNPSTSSLVLSGHTAGIRTVAISPNERWVATCGDDGTARLWDLTIEHRGAEALVLGEHTGSVWPLAFGPNGRWIVTGSADKSARLWDLTSANPTESVRLLQRHEGPVTAVAISPDGRWLVTGSSDKTARLWDLTKEDPSASALVLRGHEAGIRSVAFSPNGQWLVTVGYPITREAPVDATPRLWALAADDLGDSVILLQGHEGPVSSVAFSADGHWLATASLDRTARLWDLSSDPSAPAFVLGEHEGPVWSVAFGPDSRRFVTGCGDSTARIWTLDAHEPAEAPLVVRGHEGPVLSVTITHDGRYLVTGGSHTTRLWDLQVDSLLKRAQRLAGRELTAEEISQYLVGEL